MRIMELAKNRPRKQTGQMFAVTKDLLKESFKNSKMNLGLLKIKLHYKDRVIVASIF